MLYLKGEVQCQIKKILQEMMVKEMQGKKIPSYNVHYRAQRPDESDNDFLERILAEFKKNPSSKLECIRILSLNHMR